MKIKALEIEIIKASKKDLENLKFDCGDEDLNEFIEKDGIISLNANLSTIFLFKYKNKVIGYCALSADSIKLKKKLELSYPSYPAAKIGRLAVAKQYQNNKIGRIIIRWTIWYIKNIREDLAVRLISIDAYPEAVEFYKKNGFEIGPDNKKSRTKLMYYDLNKDK